MRAGATLGKTCLVHPPPADPISQCVQQPPSRRPCIGLAANLALKSYNAINRLRLIAFAHPNYMAFVDRPVPDKASEAAGGFAWHETPPSGHNLALPKQSRQSPLIVAVRMLIQDRGLTLSLR